MSSLESTRPSQKMQVLFMEYQESSRRVSIVYGPRGSVKETGTFYFPWVNLVYLSVRASNEALLRARVARASGIAMPPFLSCSLYSSSLVLEGVGRWSSIARIEGPQLYRGASASTEDRLAVPSRPCISIFHPIPISQPKLTPWLSDCFLSVSG